MNEPIPVAPEGGCPESPPVAAAEARAVAPAQVSAVAAVARSRLHTVGAQAPLVEVAALLSSAQISVVVVVDADGAAAGIVTETVLVRRLGLGQADFFTTNAGEVMTQEFTTCACADLLSDVLAMMHSEELVHVLLVDDDRKPLGVLAARDGLRVLLAAGNHEEAQLRNYVMGTTTAEGTNKSPTSARSAIVPAPVSAANGAGERERDVWP